VTKRLEQAWSVRRAAGYALSWRADARNTSRKFMRISVVSVHARYPGIFHSHFVPRSSCLRAICDRSIRYFESAVHLPLPPFYRKYSSDVAARTQRTRFHFLESFDDRNTCFVTGFLRGRHASYVREIKRGSRIH